MSIRPFVIPLYQPYLCGREREYVDQCMASGWISKGYFNARFERRFGHYLGDCRATTVSNGTTALHLALLASGGALSFVQADACIKHYRHPLAIYSLRAVVAILVILMLASLPMFVWAAIAPPERFGVTWIGAHSICLVLPAVFWPLITLLAYAGSRFRDLPSVMLLALQAVWFVSPVYFETVMFRRAALNALVDYNPVFHLVQIVRARLLEGNWPSAKDYGCCAGTMILFTFLAWLVGRKAEKEVIFYL